MLPLEDKQMGVYRLLRICKDSTVPVLRPSSNKKSFPVHQPVGLKRAYWNFFLSCFQKKIFFLTFPLYILVYKK